MPKRTIKLQPDERERLLKLVSLGQHPASAIRRAYILLHSDGGRTDEAIAQFLFCSEDSVRRTRIRYLTEGLDAALEDKPRPGREPVLNAQQEACEIELSVMERQCLRRRLPDELTLATELIAWERPRNDAQVKIRWKFSKQDARRVFAKYYPASSNC